MKNPNAYFETSRDKGTRPGFDKHPATYPNPCHNLKRDRHNGRKVHWRTQYAKATAHAKGHETNVLKRRNARLPKILGRRVFAGTLGEA